MSGRITRRSAKNGGPSANTEPEPNETIRVINAPPLKRRRTQSSVSTSPRKAARFEVEIPESSQLVDAGRFFSGSDSGTPDSLLTSKATTETPATGLSDEEVENSRESDGEVLEKYTRHQPGNPSLFLRNKATSKLAISDSESDDSPLSDYQEEDEEDYDSDVPLAIKKKAKGKGKMAVIDLTDDESDSNVETAMAISSRSGGEFPYYATTQERQRMNTEQRSAHNLRFRHMSRGERDRANLYSRHPALRTIWDEMEKRQMIPVEEDPQPAGLNLKLLPFQKEGLHWLRLQEQGPFGGGILADEMGMGKTIQTLALIMTDPHAKPNLVVAPTVAIMQWKSEIEKYTGSALTVYVYHGASRCNDHKELAKYNVVLTTYNILESVYRKQEHGFKRKAGLHKERSALHKVKYHRVILDEAHNIKDRSCNTAKAVYALETKYKLCLSGTPLQNRIGELFSLLRFLTIDPFAYYFCRNCPCKKLNWKFTGGRGCDSCGCPPMQHLCFFNWSLLKPIQNHGNEGEGAVAFGNIHKLLKHIMLRRTKKEREEDLGLPPKVVRVRCDKFTEEELDLYDSIYSDGKRKFDKYVAQGVVLNNYANIFTLITRMRQMADHPDLVLRKHAQEGQNNLVCFLCDDEAEDAIKSKCHHTYCRDCIQRYIDSYDGESDPQCPKCHITLSIDLSAPALEEITVKKNSIISRIDMSTWRSSTKIEALCEELHKLRTPTQTTKSIVFSQFTSMLQLIEWRLHRAGFKTAMLEGTMTPGQRAATIQHFTENIEVEVFLVSLKAGGVALNLIEANQVFIMDPWWNPSVEWQAADRIHRIGQKRTCRVTRMVIQDSIESRIVELQEKKARMIEATVNADQKAMERLTPADMQFLFQN